MLRSLVRVQVAPLVYQSCVCGRGVANATALLRLQPCTMPTRERWVGVRSRSYSKIGLGLAGYGGPVSRMALICLLAILVLTSPSSFGPSHLLTPWSLLRDARAAVLVEIAWVMNGDQTSPRGLQLWSRWYSAVIRDPQCSADRPSSEPKRKY